MRMMLPLKSSSRQSFLPVFGDDRSPRPHIWIASLRLFAKRAHVAYALHVGNVKSFCESIDTQQHAQLGIRLAILGKAMLRVPFRACPK